MQIFVVAKRAHDAKHSDKSKIQVEATPEAEFVAPPVLSADEIERLSRVEYKPFHLQSSNAPIQASMTLAPLPFVDLHLEHPGYALLPTIELKVKSDEQLQFEQELDNKRQKAAYDATLAKEEAIRRSIPQSPDVSHLTPQERFALLDQVNKEIDAAQKQEAKSKARGRGRR